MTAPMNRYGVTGVLEPVKIHVVGAGRVGSAIANCLVASGKPPQGLWSRTEAGAARAKQATGVDCAWGPFPEAVGDADIVLLAVADDAVDSVARALFQEGHLHKRQTLFHCGGAKAARVALVSLPDAFCVGTLHPLVAVPDGVRGARLLPLSYFALEGDEEAIHVGESIVNEIGAKSFQLSGDQMCLYHAAAVMASNHTVSLWHHAKLVLQEAGIEEMAATEVLLPLLKSTLENVATQGLPDALTGPVRRGDVQTIRRHLDELSQRLPQEAGLYRACTKATVETASACENAPTEEQLRKMRAALKSPNY